MHYLPLLADKNKLPKGDELTAGRRVMKLPDFGVTILTKGFCFISSKTKAANWLSEHGPKELEALFRAIVFHPSTPILVTDSNRQNREASVGAARLLGVPRENLIGRNVEDFAELDSHPTLVDRWRNFLENGQQEGTLLLIGPDGGSRAVEYIAKRDVMPQRNLLVLHDRENADVPAWVRDYALFLQNSDGVIAAWYAGAERIYGRTTAEVLGKTVSLFDPSIEAPGRMRELLQRAGREGHASTEGWETRKDGSRFWANSITMALKNEDGGLEGFATIVRDFTDRHERDEKLRLSRASLLPLPVAVSIAGIVSGEFDRILEANDSFLELVGYTRADLLAGTLRWHDLTPAEYAPFDELAHEEGLRFGACAPFEKELIRKDGNRVPVLATTAVLKLSPFRWITFIQDLRDRDRAESVNEPFVTHPGFDGMVGASPGLMLVQSLIQVVAPTTATVLILGETGTGKELVARAIHQMSPRHNNPFVTLNCAAIPTGLLESELFGYERGAFTGALSQKIGRFEMANGGTLFLDEVGDIPLELQPKLLRALQEKAFERLGGTKTIPIDVRLVAATNRNLTQMMGDKLFRPDLYYRLQVFPVNMPPLRDRPEDIPALARYFTRKYAAEMGRVIERIPADTMKALVAWPWPGNVRELENFIQRSVILSEGHSLRAPLSELRGDAKESDSALESVERDHIVRVLRETTGVVSTAAKRLGIPRTTLNTLLQKHGITRAEFKPQ